MCIRFSRHASPHHKLTTHHNSVLRSACASNAVRPFSSSTILLKKAGKANKAHALSDSTPPVNDLSGSTSTDEAYDMSGLEARILKAIERLTHELSQLRSGGRLNPELVESLKVTIGTGREGKETVRLGDIAQVVPKGRLLNVMVGDETVSFTHPFRPDSR